jgi:hypothetical protein
MKPLPIQILEFVLAQPAHKLPVIFTPGKSPLPDCSESPEDIFQEVLRLENEGLIEAVVIRDVTGKSNQAQIRYINLDGRRYLATREMKIKDDTAFRKLFLWGIAGIVILLAVVFGIKRGRPAATHPIYPQELPQTEVPVATPPTASPEATPAPSPTATPTPLPETSPSPSPSTKPKEIVLKPHSRS